MEAVAALLAASRRQQILDLKGAVVDAADIRAACLAVDEADPFGLRLTNARINGALDLRAFDVAIPLEFASCDFSDPIDVRGARLHDLTIADDQPLGHPRTHECRLPGLVGDGVQITHDLILSGMVITGNHPRRASARRISAVWLNEAVIGGRLLAEATRIIAIGGRAIHCDRSTFGGDVRLVHGFEAAGEIRILASQLGGSFDLTGALLVPNDGRALDLAEVTIGGSMFLLDSPYTKERCRISGRVEMSHATVRGQILARHAALVP